MIAFVVALLLSGSATAGELDGHWRQSCTRGFYKEEIFKGESAAYFEHNFSDPACLSPSVSTISRGTLVSGAPVLEPLGARELDFIFVSVSLRPASKVAAGYYDSVSMCGLTGWKLGEEKEITGLLCELYGPGFAVQIPHAGLRKFGLVKVEAGALYFGKLSPERNGSSPLTRPLELDPNSFRKVD